MLARSSLRFALLFAVPLALSSGALGCAAAPVDDVPAANEESSAEADAISVPVFLRSDQVSFGRAPSNTHDASKSVTADFSSPEKSAKEIINWLDKHPENKHPVYLGCIHSWEYDTSHTYRTDVHTLVTLVNAATKLPLLLYFEEENASHSPHHVSEANGHSLRTLAKSTQLLCATYASGQDSHDEVIAKVMHYRTWYHDKLGIPMTSLMIDVDTSQTPVGFYYGSRGDLAGFNQVIGWTLRSAYAHGFAGFHTYGNVGGQFGTSRAADSTYTALGKAWNTLVAAHPKQTFAGL